MSKLDEIRALREARFLELPKPKWGKPGRPKAEPKAPNIPLKRGAQRKKAN